MLIDFSSLTRLKGSWDQLWPKTGPKQQKTKTKMIIFPRGLSATKVVVVPPLFLGAQPTRRRLDRVGSAQTSSPSCEGSRAAEHSCKQTIFVRSGTRN